VAPVTRDYRSRRVHRLIRSVSRRHLTAREKRSGARRFHATLAAIEAQGSWSAGAGWRERGFRPALAATLTRRELNLVAAAGAAAFDTLFPPPGAGHTPAALASPADVAAFDRALSLFEGYTDALAILQELA
jgi:hypothetical protein